MCQGNLEKKQEKQEKFPLPTKQQFEEQVNATLGCEGIVFDYGDYDPNYDEEMSVTVRVPFEHYRRTRDKWYHDNKGKYWDYYPSVSASISPIKPPLVQAKLGDFVLVYSDVMGEVDLPVGLVTAVIRAEGKTCYGCRHIVPETDIYDKNCLRGYSFFHITSDDYGGYPTGFYKVIGRREAIRRVAAQARKNFREKVKETTREIKDIEKDIGSFVDHLTQFKHSATRLSMKEYGRRG